MASPGLRRRRVEVAGRAWVVQVRSSAEHRCDGKQVPNVRCLQAARTERSAAGRSTTEQIQDGSPLKPPAAIPEGQRWPESTLELWTIEAACECSRRQYTGWLARCSFGVSETGPTGISPVGEAIHSRSSDVFDLQAPVITGVPIFDCLWDWLQGVWTYSRL